MGQHTFFEIEYQFVNNGSAFAGPRKAVMETQKQDRKFRKFNHSRKGSNNMKRIVLITLVAALVGCTGEEIPKTAVKGTGGSGSGPAATGGAGGSSVASTGGTSTASGGATSASGGTSGSGGTVGTGGAAGMTSSTGGAGGVGGTSPTGGNVGSGGTSSVVCTDLTCLCGTSQSHASACTVSNGALIVTQCACSTGSTGGGGTGGTGTGGSVVSTGGAGGMTSTNPLYGPDWVAKHSGSRFCLNPRWLSDDPNARIRSYRDVTQTFGVLDENNWATTIVADGYCYDFTGRVVGQRFLSYGRPSRDDWAQYGAPETIDALADWAKRYIEKRYENGKFSYGVSIEWTGSLIVTRGNQ